MQEKHYFVEPATIVAVAKVSYSMWQSMQDSRQKKETRKLLKSINKKLDLVIQKQSEILDEIRALRVYFRDEIRTAFLREIEIGMASHRSSLDVIADLIGVDNKNALERIEAMEAPTRNFSFNLLERGTGAFTIALPAAVLHLSVLNLMRELGVRERVARTLELSFLDKWEDKFLYWFGPEAKDGLAYPLRLLTEARVAIQTEMERHPRRFDRGEIDTGRENQHGRTYCQIHRHRDLIITGDIQNGFADYYEEGPDYVSNRCWYNDPNRHGPSAGAIPELLFRDYDIFDPLSVRGPEKIIEDEPSGSYYDNARKIAFGLHSEQIVPVNDPVTVALNRRRAEWIKALDQETTFAAFVKIVQDTRAGFALRAKELR